MTKIKLIEWFDRHTHTPPRNWLASFVRRWHCNSDLAHTNDSIAGHGARMAILALTYWPDASRELLVACVTHDLGESVTGDIPFGAANKDPYQEQTALAEMGFGQPLSETDHARLKWLDRLDAYFWAMNAAPWLRKRADWKVAAKWLTDHAPDAICAPPEGHVDELRASGTGSQLWHVTDITRGRGELSCPLAASPCDGPVAGAIRGVW